MRLAEAFAASPWVVWAVALILGYPLAVVLLSEVLERVEERGRPLRAPLRHLRNVTLPLVALLIFLQELARLPADATPVKLVYTATLVSVFFALLSMANALLFSEASEDSWRARVPKLFLDLSRVFFVFVALALVLALVWGQDLGGLLAALGIGSLVIGLALQDTLGNLFSGVALLFEKPFSVGEFIRVGEREGRVVAQTWRSTRIHLGDTHSTLVIPNLTLAKENVVNLSRPGHHAISMPLRFSPEDPPNQVKTSLIEATSAVPGVLHEPPPSARTIGYGDGWVDYEVSFAVMSYAARRAVRGELMSRLWYVARRQGLTLSPSTAAARAPIAEAAHADSSKASRVQHALAKIPVLQGLPDEVMEDLAASGVVQRFARGEFVFREGDTSTTLYMVVDGDVLLTTSDAEGVEREVTSLSRGEFLGLRQVVLRAPSTVSLLASTDLLVVAVPGEAAGRLLDRSPRLANELGEAQEARRKATVLAKQGHTRAIG